MYKRYIKRLIDITLSFVGMIVLIPVFLIVGLVIYIDDPGPILFTQQRFGENKKLFKLHKFRSMKVKTPDLPTHLLNDPNQYITKVGKIIRKVVQNGQCAVCLGYVFTVNHTSFSVINVHAVLRGSITNRLWVNTPHAPDAPGIPQALQDPRPQ